jgi:FxsC-like protein
MRHLLFLGYARKDTDSHLREFFRELRQAIAINTPWTWDEKELAFQDTNSLGLGEQWEPKLREALENSCVFVCLTSPKYFERAFCGREFYIFQRRIQKYAGDKNYLPPVIFPVIWVPHEMSHQIDPYAWKSDKLPEDYEKLGLRDLRWRKKPQYRNALAAIAQSIIDRWKPRKNETERPSEVVQEFEKIPNAFGGDDWGEAADGKSWITGPGVANVVYGAGTKRTVSPKYGELAREWKPYLPPVAQTVGDLTRSVIHEHSLKYREIPVDDNLDQELKQAQERKNLIVVVADAASLSHEPNPKLSAYDPLKPEGTALLMPWDESHESPWESEALNKNINEIFPVKSRTPECFRAPILSVDKLRSTLETTLVEIRANLTKQEANNKQVIDAAPATVSGAM